MRLLLCHNFYRQDSGENLAFRLLAEILRAHGQEVIEYTRDNRELERLSPAARARVFADGFHSARTAREVTALVERFRPAAALVQNVFPLISPSVYSALRGAHVPVAQLVYNYRFVCPNAHLFTRGQVCERCVRGATVNAVIHRCYRDSRLLSAWYAGIVGLHRARRTFAAIDRFLAPDDFMRRKLAQGGLPAERMAVVGNPFDIADYAPSRVEERFALFVGRLVPQKGILTLVRAFGRISASGASASGDASYGGAASGDASDGGAAAGDASYGGAASGDASDGGDVRPLSLIVVGEGEGRAEAERLAARVAARGVEFRGAVWGEALRDLLARCAFACIPSEWYDNAPLILYQAFAAGKPVIASRINGLPEVVADGEDGLLATPGNVADWARQISRLAADSGLRRRLGANARRKAESEFAAPAYYRRLRGVLDELVEAAL